MHLLFPNESNRIGIPVLILGIPKILERRIVFPLLEHSVSQAHKRVLKIGVFPRQLRPKLVGFLVIAVKLTGLRLQNQLAVGRRLEYQHLSKSAVQHQQIVP